MKIRTFQDSDELAVVGLWSRCGLLRPWNNPRKDIARKRRLQPDGFLVGVLDGSVVATAMVGYEGHRGWINYLAVDPSLRRQGLGRTMMAAAEEWLHALGCAKINIQIRRDNGDALGFYERLGFRRDDVVTLGKRLEHDDR